MTQRLYPNFTFLADTLEGVPIHPYLPKTSMTIDGTRYFFNGWNQPWYADIGAGKLFPLGSNAPTTFAVNDAPAGATFPINTVLFYYLVFRNDARGEETAPQATGGVAGVSHQMSGTKDALITWTDPGDGRWTTADIYRRYQNSDLIVRVASVPIATATYTDSTADAALDETDLYIPRYRLTVVPKFLAAAPHLGRILAVTGKDSIIRFSQRVRADGELVQVDFPEKNLIAVDIDDGLGEIVALVAHYDTILAFKRRGIVLIEGDPALDDFAFRRMYEGRGAFGPRCVIPVHETFIVWDEQGMYEWGPSAEPRILGARGGTISPLAPLWERVNRAAWLNCHLAFRQHQSLVEAYGPLDHEPIAMRAIAVWNREHDRFDSVDDRVAMATGKHEDASGKEHDVYLDDLGFEHERAILDSQGVTGGDVHATFLVAPGELGRIAAAGASFEDEPTLGPTAEFMERRDADGTLLDENRVYATFPAQIDTLYWFDEALALSQTLDVGVMVSTAEFARSDYETADRKTIRNLIMRYKPLDTILGTSPTLNVYTSPDERDYALQRTLDMTNVDGWGIVPCWDRGFHFNLKIEKRKATDRFALEAVTADLWTGRLRR